MNSSALKFQIALQCCKQCCGLALVSMAHPDPEPAFHLTADTDPDLGSQTNPDPCGPESCKNFAVNADTDPDLGRQTNPDPCGSESCKNFAIKKVEFLYINIGTLCRRVRIHIPNTDPVPTEPNQSGSKRIGIHNADTRERFLSDRI